MKPYSVEIEMTTRWTVEIHANDEDEVQQIVEEGGFDEDDGSFKEVQSVEIINIEEITDVDNDY